MSLWTPRSTAESETWTVTELTAYIRELFEVDYRLKDVTVTGELSNFRPARSGHLYFTLKDEKTQIPCVMWKSQAFRLAFSPGDGDAVVVRGRVSVYEAGGNYQLYADSIQPVGRGNLALAFERLKQKLADEGLFDAAHKKAIPTLPRKIGLVTSADAAALRDILNVLRRRFPLVQLLIAPTLVQGAEAPPQIIRALRWLDEREDIDTIILARGGGSIEDLWAFNDETLARTIFQARHPIICGVGHEIDFTIADFVADLRAPTPSAAAELATPDIEELKAIVQGLKTILDNQIHGLIRQKEWQLQSLSRSLAHLTPQAQLDNHQQRLDGLAIRLDQAMQRRLERVKGRLAVAQAHLQAISPLATLARGYAIVRQPDGKIVRLVEDAAAGDTIHIQLSDGSLQVRVI
ncbi:MAG: exodeoxyribonuclease VII large subunit [Chloroflexi bacterium]|nr:exodeoxyribonuclease VII large subunit [Chloroflexota bacterium]MBP8056314.1 exodeoxyribonuclease VII large subunit [Chloroflexota bacterium]